MSISSEQTYEHENRFDDLQEAARDQLLSELVAFTLPPEIPEGYYTARDMYAEAVKASPGLDFDRYRNHLRLMAERGQLATFYVGRNVFYGIESKV